MKTKVLLAFGRWNSGESKKKVTEQSFFRATIGPFLERESREQRQVIVIPEQKIGSDLFEPDHPLFGQTSLFFSLINSTGVFPPNHILQPLFDVAVAQEVDRINTLYAFTLNVGTGLDKFKLYGFEDIAVRLNRAKPNSVRFVCEAQTLETFLATGLDWAALNLPSGDVLSGIAEGIRAIAELAYVRDKTLVTQITELASSGNGVSFVVSREILNTGMRVLFDPSLFDLEVCPAAIEDYERSLSRTIGPSFDAICRRYRGKLSEEELLRFAAATRLFKPPLIPES